MPTMVRSLVARRAEQAERRAANAAVAAAPPLSPAHPPVLPRPRRNGCRRGNGDGEERLLTPTVDRMVAIFDSLVAASGPPTKASSTTATIVATTTAPAGNDDVDESLELNKFPIILCVLLQK